MPYVAEPFPSPDTTPFLGTGHNYGVYLHACHLHKALAYLDLSLRETTSYPSCFSSLETLRKRFNRCCGQSCIVRRPDGKVITTNRREEGIKSRFARLLYKFSREVIFIKRNIEGDYQSCNGTLDSLDLDSDRRVIDWFEKSCYKYFFDVFEDYQSNFRMLLADHILAYIQNSRDIIGMVKNHLNVLRTIILYGKDPSINRYVSNRVMKVLMEHCEDSHLVVEVVTSLSSIYEFMMFLVQIDGPKLKLMEYVMYHCQKARFDFWAVLSNRLIHSTNGYPHLFKTSFERHEVLRILLKYGVSIETAACLFFCDRRYEWFRERLQRMHIDEEPDRRETLRHILSCFYLDYKKRELSLEQGQECIRMIWDYLPDAYHSATELEEYIIRQQLCSYRTLNELCDWYINNIAVETLGILQPRSLQQLCRVVIRKKLSRNFQLPEGIANLGLPPPIQKYLRLDGKFYYLTFFNSRDYIRFRDV